MADELLENPQALVENVARVLGGRPAAESELAGYVNSDFDPFLNQLFAARKLTRSEAAEALQGRPGFVWLAGPAADDDATAMQGMTADLRETVPSPSLAADVAEVRSRADLDSWHAVYSEVFGADPRSRDDWRRVHEALGPTGDGSLLLLLARVHGSPAATGSVFFAQGVAGLYCFTTRGALRGRGLASALVHAAHDAARANGVARAVLQATPSGAPVYARAGYENERPLPLLAFRRTPDQSWRS